MSYFPEKLKELRIFKDLLQKDVAKDLNLALTTYHNYESGRTEPSYDLLIKIADYYDVTLDELTGREPKTRAEEAQDNDIVNLIQSYKRLNKEQRQHVRIVMSAFLNDKEKIYKEIFNDEDDKNFFKTS